MEWLDTWESPTKVHTLRNTQRGFSIFVFLILSVSIMIFLFTIKLRVSFDQCAADCWWRGTTQISAQQAMLSDVCTKIFWTSWTRISFWGWKNLSIN